MAQLGLGLHTTPGILSSLDLGSAGDTGQPGTASLAQDGPQVDWAWEVHEIHGPPVTVPSRGTQELECLDLRSAHHLGLWQTLCCPFTTRAPHKSQRYLFAVFLRLHNTTEQMTLNRIYYCPFLSGLRLDIEETCKQRRPAYVKIRQESHSKSCRFRRLKSSSKIAFKDNCRL